MVPAAMVYLGWEVRERMKSDQQNGEPDVSYKEYLDEIVLQNAPTITQVDRGLLVEDEEEVKKKKSRNDDHVLCRSQCLQ